MSTGLHGKTEMNVALITHVFIGLPELRWVTWLPSLMKKKHEENECLHASSKVFVLLLKLRQLQCIHLPVFSKHSSRAVIVRQKVYNCFISELMIPIQFRNILTESLQITENMNCLIDCWGLPHLYLTEMRHACPSASSDYCSLGMIGTTWGWHQIQQRSPLFVKIIFMIKGIRCCWQVQYKQSNQFPAFWNQQSLKGGLMVSDKHQIVFFSKR